MLNKLVYITLTMLNKLHVVYILYNTNNAYMLTIILIPYLTI